MVVYLQKSQDQSAVYSGIDFKASVDSFIAWLLYGILRFSNISTTKE
jgi:hypothetical protein